MARIRGKKDWRILILLLLAAMMIGGLIWSLLAPILPGWLSGTFPVGAVNGPWTLDLHFMSVSFGLVINFNLGCVIAMLVALILNLVR